MHCNQCLNIGIINILSHLFSTFAMLPLLSRDRYDVGCNGRKAVLRTFCVLLSVCVEMMPPHLVMCLCHVLN